jgi:uncharacterized protein
MNMFDPRQKRLLLKAKEYYAKNHPDYAHGFDHTARVVYWAKMLCKKEGADCNIVIPAAILHDVGIPRAGDEGHARKGTEMCREFLNEYDEREIEEIALAIRQHSTDDPVDEGETRTVEGNILFDADKLDCLGTACFYRWMFQYQKQGKLVHECARLTLEHVERWRKRYGGEIFFTDAARKIARERLRRTEGLCEEILEETEQFKGIYGEAGISL